MPCFFGVRSGGELCWGPARPFRPFPSGGCFVSSRGAGRGQSDHQGKRSSSGPRPSCLVASFSTPCPRSLLRIAARVCWGGNQSEGAVSVLRWWVGVASVWLAPSLSVSAGASVWGRRWESVPRPSSCALRALYVLNRSICRLCASRHSNNNTGGIPRGDPPG